MRAVSRGVTVLEPTAAFSARPLRGRFSGPSSPGLSSLTPSDFADR
jgi:hypothetical protein